MPTSFLSDLSPAPSTPSSDYIQCQPSTPKGRAQSADVSMTPRAQYLDQVTDAPQEEGLCTRPTPQCHGPSLDNDKAPAMGHGSSLDDKVPAVPPATTSIAKLPMVAIGEHDLSFESHSIQDLDALVDAELLWDVRGEGAEKRKRERG